MSVKTFFLATAAVVALSSPAAAGCVGASVGDGCIGIPTPHEHHGDYSRRRYEDRPSRDETVIIKKHRHHHDDDED